ncbi:small integral membrane protein 28-like [Erpetoichthys calabaricus]|uniref:small integral membrane protein 28-like n=1 Tax=Erpetoichthys calabaricus TaxID=27687 RepID=UPI0022344FD9|nr:small integral membrane protein 28-like [Erpetoichthys calabaricus]
MWKLLESSWMKFGPAGRGAYDWVTGAPPPLMEKQLQDEQWNEFPVHGDSEVEIIFYFVLPTASLLLIGILAFLLYQRCGHRKTCPSNIVTVDLQEDGTSAADPLAVLTAESEQCPFDGSHTEGVFLMVYLPPPYEKTVTKISKVGSDEPTSPEVLLPFQLDVETKS